MCFMVMYMPSKSIESDYSVIMTKHVAVILQQNILLSVLYSTYIFLGFIFTENVPVNNYII